MHSLINYRTVTGDRLSSLTYQLEQLESQYDCLIIHIAQENMLCNGGVQLQWVALVRTSPKTQMTLNG